MSAWEYSFLHCLKELAGFVSAKRCDYLLIAGDFNVDFSHINRQCTSFLSDMMDFDLEVVDLQYSTAVQFTYDRDDGGAHSCVDHFLISSIMSSVCRVASLHSGSNLSDHVPLTLTLECSGPVVCLLHPVHLFNARLGIKHQMSLFDTRSKVENVWLLFT